MKARKVSSVFIAMILALAGASCGGGGGGGSSPSSGPASETVGTSSGAITGTGSVIVNGIRFDTTNCTVTSNGSPGRAADLRIGMVVRVRGNFNSDGKTGSAKDISYFSEITGPISSKDMAAKTFLVFGITVQVDTLTIFEDVADLNVLPLNSIVEVSGFPDNGKIRATYVELKTTMPAATTPLEVKGMVANLNTTAKTFEIGALKVDYASATLQDFPAGGIANGQSVEIQSTFGQYSAATNTLKAARVEFDPGCGAAEGERIELEGIVSNFSAANKTFTLQGITVNASALTLPAGFGNGAHVEVEGRMQNNVLIAQEMEREMENHIEIEGDASATDTTAGTITLLGIQVTTNSTTTFKDDTGQLSTFALKDITLGMHLNVGGYLDGNGKVIATRVERRPATTMMMIQGPVSAKSGTSSLTLLGVTVDTSTPGVEFRDINGAPITAAVFYGSITLNTTVVKAAGNNFDSANKILKVYEAELETS